MSSFMFRLCAVALGGYSALIGVLAWLWRRQSQRWWAAVSVIFSAHWFWPLLATVPLAVWSRSWLLRALAVPPLGVFLWLFGRQFVPPRRTAVQGQPLRVATFNVLYLNTEYDAISQAIRQLDADIVALQEITEACSAALAAQFAETFPHQLHFPDEKQHGFALLSRLPLGAAYRDYGFFGMHTTCEIAGRTLNIINTHPTTAKISRRRVFGLPLVTGYKPGLRAYNISSLVRYIDKLEGDLIVAGDFNTSDREPLYGQLASRLRDAFREAGWGFGFTFPARLARGRLRLPASLIRIDYVWLRGAVHARQCRVVRQNGGSDHCIVVADLVLDDPA